MRDMLSICITTIATLIFITGCASITYRDQGRSFSYSRMGSQNIKGLTVNQYGNSISVTIESTQSDTQALTTAVETLAGKVK